ncbi:MAG: hypothetical protein ACXWPM_11765 [Bdellovibrionota bacterium]
METIVPAAAVPGDPGDPVGGPWLPPQEGATTKTAPNKESNKVLLFRIFGTPNAQDIPAFLERRL